MKTLKPLKSSLCLYQALCYGNCCLYLVLERRPEPQKKSAIGKAHTTNKRKKIGVAFQHTFGWLAPVFWARCVWPILWCPIKACNSPTKSCNPKKACNNKGRVFTKSFLSGICGQRSQPGNCTGRIYVYAAQQFLNTFPALFQETVTAPPWFINFLCRLTYFSVGSVLSLHVKWVMLLRIFTNEDTRHGTSPGALGYGDLFLAMCHLHFSSQLHWRHYSSDKNRKIIAHVCMHWSYLHEIDRECLPVLTNKPKKENAVWCCKMARELPHFLISVCLSLEIML